MTAFWIGAAVLAAVALAFLLVPLWRETKSTGRLSYTALVAAVAIVPLAFALYAGVRTWQPELLEQRVRQLEQQREEHELVALLAARLEQNPDEVEGWRLLGRAYISLEDYASARRAFEQAWQRMPTPDNELKLSLAEAYVLEDQTMLGGPAGELVEEVLREEPSNPKALWYGGQRAFGLGNHDAARDRLARLLALGVPSDLAQIIEAQLAQLPPAGEGGPVRSEGAAGPEVEIAVRLAEGLSIEDFGESAALFIFARAPGGGAPIAARRAPANAVPGEIVLSDRDAMLPGSSLGDHAELDLVARVSSTGQPTESAGDLYGQKLYRPGEDSRVELVIDKIVE